MFDFLLLSIDKHLFSVYNNSRKEHPFGTDVLYKSMLAQEKQLQKICRKGRIQIMKGKRSHTQNRRRSVYTKKLTLFLTAFVMAAGLSIFAGKALASAHGTRQQEPVDYRYYKSIQIGAGDTLWNIAETYKDEGTSTGDYIRDLKEMNHLDSDTIHEGSYLTIAYTDQTFR